MKIKIPFNLWSQDKLLFGLKTATSRHKKYGDVGDTFEMADRTYYINLIVKLPIWFIRNELYLTEGCDTPEEFEKIWTEIYHVFKLTEEVWYHHFTKMKK